MKKLIILSCAVVLLLGLSGVASASITINYLWADDGNGGFTSPYAGVAVETFDKAVLSLPYTAPPNTDALVQPWTWSGDGAVVKSSVDGQYAAPFGQIAADTTQYLTVPLNLANGSTTTVLFGADYNYFGLWWGSVDSYNTIAFYDDGALVASFTGTQAITPSSANGNQTAPLENLYVNFLFGSEDFDKIVFTSTQYAFESDNMAVGNVPIPGAVWLLGSGLLGLLGFRRKVLG